MLSPGERRLHPIVTPGGVLVTTHREDILRIPAVTGIRALRFHGEERPADPEGYPVPVLKAFRVRPGFEPSGLAAYPGGTYLLDTALEGC